jgi:HEAT repeat protein
MIAFMVALAGVGCSTTEQEVQEQIEILAANDIDSDAWKGATDELTLIGRPAARQLVALLDPALYKGKSYREFPSEMEKTRTGAALVLGRIRHKAAAVSLSARITNVYTFGERVTALEAVGELGFNADAVKALKKQFDIETDPVILLHIGIALIKMEDDAGESALKRAISGDDDGLAATAIAGLQAANYFGVDLMVELADRGIREEALRAAIAGTRGKLVSQLESEDPEIRMHSARALGLAADPSVSTALVKLLDDKSNQVRFSAASSLTTLGDPTGTEFLFASMRGDDSIQRLNAIRSLVEVQVRSGTVEKQLIDGLTSSEPLARSGCAQILGEAGVNDAVPDLLRTTEDSVAEVRWSAIIALGRLTAVDGRAQLEKLREDEDATVAYYAKWALRQLGAG